MVGATTTNFALDSALALPEVIYTSQGTKYLHLPGVTMAQNAANQQVYLLPDGLGSIRQVMSGTTVVSRRDFDPYGNLPPANPATFQPPYGFSGEWWENDVQLLHLRARWYDPSNAIFLSKDPYPGDPMRPQSLISHVLRKYDRGPGAEDRKIANSRVLGLRSSSAKDFYERDVPLAHEHS